jgi:hypothetical protein
LYIVKRKLLGGALLLGKWKFSFDKKHFKKVGKQMARVFFK